MAWELLAAIQSTSSVWEDAHLKVRTIIHTQSQISQCLPQDFTANLPNYCARRVLRSPTMWLGIFTGGFVFNLSYSSGSTLTLTFRFFTLILMMYRVRGAILMGIFLTSIISWPRPTPVTYFPHTEAGDAMFDYFKQVVAFQPLDKIGNVIDVSLFFCSGGRWN